MDNPYEQGTDSPWIIFPFLFCTLALLVIVIHVGFNVGLFTSIGIVGAILVTIVLVLIPVLYFAGALDVEVD